MPLPGELDDVGSKYIHNYVKKHAKCELKT